MESNTISEIKGELSGLIDKYFPKIKPQGTNPGRGESAVIVGTALERFEQALQLLSSKVEDMRRYKFDHVDGPSYDADVQEERGFNSALDQVLSAIKEIMA